MLNNLLFKRRSTRKFLPVKIEDEKIRNILSAALLAPSSKNSRPWEFIVVDDAASLEILSKAKPHSAALIKNAPLAIIIIGDRTKSDVWIEDCSIASILIQLEAENQGLGSCWVQIHRRFHDDDMTSNEYIQLHFDIPENLEVLSIVAIGYKATDGVPVNKELLWEKIWNNKFNVRHQFSGIVISEY